VAQGVSSALVAIADFDAAPFSIKVRLDPLRMDDRYRWAISEGERTIKHSSYTYGTKIQAEAAANEALSRIEAQRRREK
jgi:hypothetical protein